MSRRLARQAVMSLLYERDINKEPNDDTLEEMKDVLKTEEFIEKHGDFVDSVMSVYDKNSELVDAHIRENCVGWKFERLSKVDVAILRLAITEILYVGTPAKVAVNEAVELAKAYSEDKSASFINGVLASVITKEAVVCD